MSSIMPSPIIENAQHASTGLLLLSFMSVGAALVAQSPMMIYLSVGLVLLSAVIWMLTHSIMS